MVEVIESRTYFNVCSGFVFKGVFMILTEWLISDTILYENNSIPDTLEILDKELQSLLKEEIK